MNVALIGLGPHAKRIYINYFKKYKVNLKLVVELESFRDKTKRYLMDNGFKNTNIFTIEDDIKDCKHLPKMVSENLFSVLKTLEITHLIISTEAKAHFMYIEFGLKNNFQVLTDKPISVTKNMTSLKSIEEVRREYYELLELANSSHGSCKVMCQRQYHRGYEKVKEILSKVVEKYGVPITNIEISYSDGTWEMPHDMEKENHPYKYGYGELFHSGYHFIDLLSDLLKINDTLSQNKRIVKGEVYSKVFTPKDELNIIDLESYKRLFKGQIIPSYYYENKSINFNKYGEKDYHGLLTFYNKNGYTITSATLNLLHNGVSKRSYIETRDFYKSNGRIRHERVDISIGHLLNIQIHSYQSKEISERTSEEDGIGGLEHFDIYIFSNPLIDKEAFREIHLKDLYTDKEIKDFLGYNELAREMFINNFFKNCKCKGDIKNQALGVEILYSCSKGLYNHYKKKKRVEKIEVINNYTYSLIPKSLNKCKIDTYKNYDSETIKGDVYLKDMYTFYNYVNYVSELNKYVVNISIDDSVNVLGGLFLKVYDKKIYAYIYYKFLEFLIRFLSISSILKLLERKSAN